MRKRVARSAGAPPLAGQGLEWREPSLLSSPRPPSPDIQALLGALRAGLEEQPLNARVLPAPQSLLPTTPPTRLITMTKLSAQVKGSLNITTPGVQIWRIEVRPAWAWEVEED